mmetsp:Transcript_17547/g.42850  ORF Transcript_17547/g.42850 Transcript_17547/m.42850 type:complete len:217 (-) Transcript_17547:6976-7626(-)
MARSVNTQTPEQHATEREPERVEFFGLAVGSSEAVTMETPESLLTTRPTSSCTWTTGCTPKTDAAKASLGMEQRLRETPLRVTLKGIENAGLHTDPVAAMHAGLVKRSWYPLPAVSTRKPRKSATPLRVMTSRPRTETSCTPAPLTSSTDTTPLSRDATLFPTSDRAIDGCRWKGTPSRKPHGCVAKRRRTASPGNTDSREEASAHRRVLLVKRMV